MKFVLFSCKSFSQDWDLKEAWFFTQTLLKAFKIAKISDMN